MKLIDEEEYMSIKNELLEAGKDLEHKKALTLDIYDKIERDLILVGATAVEDKL